MKRFIILLSLTGSCLMTIGCSTRSLSLSNNDPFQTEGDPFEVAAAMSAQQGTSQQTASQPRTSTPGYAAMNNGARMASGGSKPGWSSTRDAAPTGIPAATPQQPWQTAVAPQDNIQMTFRAATSVPESQTQVVSSADTPEPATGIPQVGASASRAMPTDDPFQAGGVQNADFTDGQKSTITQLTAKQPSQLSPAKLEMPVFTDEEDPFSQATPQPAQTKDEWWSQ